MFRKLFLLLIVLFLGGYAAAEVYAKGYAEEKIAEAAAEKDPLARGSDAEVSFPVIFQVVARSRIDRVVIVNRHVDVGPFLADEIGATLTGVHIDRAESIARRGPKITSIDRLETMIVVSQTEASKALPEGFSFEFGHGNVRLLGPGLEISGKLEANGDSSLTFRPDQGQLPRGVRASFGLAELPYLACVLNVAVELGVMRISCSTEDPPVEWVNAR